MTDLDKRFQQYFNNQQSSFMLARQVQLGIGCGILLYIIVAICIKKLFVFNTTRMLFFSCICYFIGMFVVLLHQESFASGYKFSYDQIYKDKQSTNQNYILNILNKMKDNGHLILCGLEAFMNLFMYNLAYFFAILISYNVFCVINDNYKNFMRNLFKKAKVWIFLGIMLGAYLLPLIFMFIPSTFNDDQYYYSYGPTGFKQELTLTERDIEYTRVANLLFYCGTCFKPGSNSRWVGVIHIYILYPFIMLIIHAKILWQNNKKLKSLNNQQFLNSKQKFLINSGKISIVVFIIQSLNAIKLLLSLILGKFYIILTILNFVFDLYPIAMGYFFWRYTKQKKGLQHGSSTLIQQ